MIEDRVKQLNKNDYWILFVSLVSVAGLILAIVMMYLDYKDVPSASPKGVKYPDSSQKSLNKIVIPINLQTDSLAKKDTSNRGIKLFVDTLSKVISGADSLKYNKATVELLEYSSSSGTEFSTENAYNIKMKESAPQAGFGKLAIRSYCDYAESSAWVDIDNNDGKAGPCNRCGSVSAMYDPKNKRETTFVQELYPGIYHVMLNYGQQGTANFNVEVFENKISLYRYRKTNPFGKGNGQIAFITDFATHKWKITIDNKFYRVITMKPKQGVFVNVKADYHTFKVESLTPHKEGIDNDADSGHVKPAIGERTYIRIN